MNRKPMFPPTVFHRIKFSSDSSLFDRESRRLQEMIDKRSASMAGVPANGKDPVKVFHKGHGLVVASWNRWEPDTRAKVHALGVVVRNSAKNGIDVRWVRTPRCELRKVTSNGDRYWDQQTFEFEDEVAKRFLLEELFEEFRTDLTIAST